METRSLVWCPTSCLTPIWGRCIPPPLQGGVAAASIKSREATEEPQTGWSLTRHVSQTHSEASLVSDHPVRAFFRNGSILLMARPPLLCKEGNAPTQIGVKHEVGHRTSMTWASRGHSGPRTREPCCC